MTNFSFTKKYLTIKGNTISFEGREFYQVVCIGNLLLIIFEESSVNTDIAYDNVIAVDLKTGEKKWQVEKYLDPQEETSAYKSLGPFLDAIPGNEEYIIFLKYYGWKVPVI